MVGVGVTSIRVMVEVVVVPIKTVMVTVVVKGWRAWASPPFV